MTDVDLSEPVFFERNRVWRCYTGGLLLDRFLGNADAVDGHLPEEWIASTTVALNGPHQQSEHEGLSRVALPDGTSGPLLRDLVRERPEECLGPGTTAEAVGAEGIGVLSKFLDSAVRLPIQCHPDRAFAREHYGSEHGKTESWLVLGTRAVEGQEPYLLMGFRPGTQREAFARAVGDQDVRAMESMLHRVPARPGDAYIIPGRFPHAIGPGVFLLEVQEPTDWVVQPERWIGDTELSDTDMWGPLEPSAGLECFDYAGAGGLEEILERTRLGTEAQSAAGGSAVERVIGPDVTDCFRVDRLTVEESAEYAHDAPFYVAIVTAGRGEVEAGGEPRSVKQGDTFFVSNIVESMHYRASREAGEAPLTVYLVS